MSEKVDWMNLSPEDLGGFDKDTEAILSHVTPPKEDIQVNSVSQILRNYSTKSDRSHVVM